VVVEANIRALMERAPGSPALERYAVIAVHVVDGDFAGFDVFLDWLRTFCDRLRIPPLSAYGLSGRDIPALVAQAQKASSMKGNPIQLTDKELDGILQQALSWQPAQP